VPELETAALINQLGASIGTLVNSRYVTAPSLTEPQSHWIRPKKRPLVSDDECYRHTA